MTAAQELGLDNFKHLDDAVLLSMLDGELGNTEQERADTHLAACWSCRERQTQMESSIGQFLSFRETLRPDDAGSLPAPVEQFRQRLSRHIEEREAKRSAWSRMTEGLREAAGSLFWNRQAALAAVVVAVILVATFTDVLTTTASAETLLRRAEGYESSRVPGSSSVVLRSIRMEHIDAQHRSRNLGTLKIAHDAGGSVYIAEAEAKRGMLISPASGAETSKLLPEEGALPASVERYLEAERWLPDVSVSEFRKLVAARQSSDTSSKQAGSLYEVSYPFASGHPSGIREARLDMDAKTYEPERVCIVTADAGEFRFTRVRESDEPRSEEWARIFDAPAPPSTRVHGLPSLKKPSPLMYASSRASEHEVVVAAALHKLDACLGEEIYVFPMSDGTVLVQGLVDRPERRDAIRAALRSLVFPVAVQVSTPKEWVGGALYPPPDQLAVANLPRGTGARITVADASGKEIPLYDEISRHVTKPGMTEDELHQRVASFSNEAVTLSRQALLHAWALRRWDAEFSEGRIAQLPATARQTAERLRSEHRQAISRLTRRQAELLASLTGRSLDQEAAGPQLQDAATLLHLAEQQNLLMRRLFTVSEAVGDTQANLNDVLTTLHQISR